MQVMTRQRIRRGVFRSIVDLQAAMSKEDSTSNVSAADTAANPTGLLHGVFLSWTPKMRQVDKVEACP